MVVPPPPPNMPINSHSSAVPQGPVTSDSAADFDISRHLTLVYSSMYSRDVFS